MCSVWIQNQLKIYSLNFFPILKNDMNDFTIKVLPVQGNQIFKEQFSKEYFDEKAKFWCYILLSSLKNHKFKVFSSKSRVFDFVPIHNSFVTLLYFFLVQKMYVTNDSYHYYFCWRRFSTWININSLEPPRKKGFPSEIPKSFIDRFHL